MQAALLGTAKAHRRRGLNVYVVNNIARDEPMAKTYEGVFPFRARDVLRVILLLVFPAISLGLVRLLYG